MSRQKIESRCGTAHLPPNADASEGFSGGSCIFEARGDHLRYSRCRDDGGVASYAGCDCDESMAVLEARRMQTLATVTPHVRRYRPKWWMRIFSLFFFFFSMAGLVHFLGEMLGGKRPPNTTEILVPVPSHTCGLRNGGSFFHDFRLAFPGCN